MRTRLLILPLGVLLLSAALPVRAAEPSPDALLAEESLLYVRFDGFQPHQQAYRETILADIVRDELQPLIDDAKRRILDALGPEVLSEQLLAGENPDRLLEAQEAAKQLPHLFTYLNRHGFAAGVEVISPMPPNPRWQVTFVFPEGGTGENRKALVGALRLIAMAGEVPLEEQKQGDRSILQFQPKGEPVRVACWSEGDHLLVTVGSEEADHTLSLISGDRTSLADGDVLKRVAGFDGYATYARGFADFQRVLSVVQKVFPPAAAIAQQLGLDGLGSFAFHLGFEGSYQRSTLVLETTGERKGLLRLLTAPGPVGLEQLPPLPPDAVTVHASRADLSDSYNVILDTGQIAMQFADPGGSETFRGTVKRFEESLGVDLQKDLLNPLGSTMVVYNAESEGPLMLGTTVMLEVEDAETLKTSLPALVRSLGNLTGSDISLETRGYREAELNMVSINERGFPFLPTFTIHDGWLVVAFYPQPVQGFLYRSDGDHETWQPPALAQRLLQKVGGENGAQVTGFGAADPRVTLQQVLTAAPFITALARSFSGTGNDRFDLSLIPNSQAVTERLGANVQLFVDDGDAVRIEGYSTFPMPIHLSGLELYALSTVTPFLFLGAAF